MRPRLPGGRDGDFTGCEDAAEHWRRLHRLRPLRDGLRDDAERDDRATIEELTWVE